MQPPKTPFSIILKAINQIDDFFEYANESEKDRRKVKEILTNMNEELAELVGETNERSS